MLVRHSPGFKFATKALPAVSLALMVWCCASQRSGGRRRLIRSSACMTDRTGHTTTRISGVSI